MRKSNLFLAHQIARFGAMTIHQMELACASKCGRATVYRMLKDLLKRKLIKRVPQMEDAKFLYVPNPDLNAMIYKEETKRNTGFSQSRQHHALTVAEVLIALSRYSFVSGITTEFEIDSTEIAKFCHSRTPDGVIQITNATHSFELAVEVETSRKIAGRIDEVLEKYRHTFMRGMPCGGLLVVTKDQTLCDVYQSKISKLPEDIGNRCLAVTMDGLSSLNQKHFGEYKECSQSSLDRIATWYEGSPKFSPITSKSYSKLIRSVDPYIDGE